MTLGSYPGQKNENAYVSILVVRKKQSLLGGQNPKLQFVTDTLDTQVLSQLNNKIS